MNEIAQIVVLTLAAGTPLVFAALGELVVEKSGVLNLGVEGMMLVGAIASFIVAANGCAPPIPPSPRRTRRGWTWPRARSPARCCR